MHINSAKQFMMKYTRNRRNIIYNINNINNTNNKTLTTTTFNNIDSSIKNKGYDSIDTVLQTYMNDTANEKKNYIIITGGIGDFLTIDYFLNLSSTKNIIFLTKQSMIMKTLLNSIELNKKKYFAVYYNFDLIGKPGFDTANEIFSKFPEMIKIYMIPVVDISSYFPLFKNKLATIYKNRHICFSKVINRKYIADIDIKTRFNLPDNIAFISPYTEDNRLSCINCGTFHSTPIPKCNYIRNFDSNDFNNCFKILKERNLLGIIISIKDTIIHPDISSQFINLSKQTNILESIEILKISKMYIGIDSFLAVMASKIFERPNLIIKSVNDNAYNNKNLYYFPKININLVKNI